MKRMNKYIGAIALGAVVMAMPGCSDTWDEHYTDGMSGNTTATKNLWEQITSNPKLSKFAAIAEATPYYKDEKHPLSQNGKIYTFKDMLNGTQLLTVWAPENDAISDAEYANWLKLAETRGYTVQQQLMGNNIALWHQIANGGGEDELRMLNGKKVIFDKDNATIAGLKMQEKNIPATNGTLHTLLSPLPFNYNIYEYLKDEVNSEQNSVKKYHDYVIGNDTTYFFESGSIEGNPDENGNPTYVDSAYITTNTMFGMKKRYPSQTNTDQYLSYQESFGANIESEDSSFVLVMPTDAAWDAAYEKLKGLYNYANVYLDNDKENGGTSKMTRVVGEQAQVDSLRDQSIANDITSPLCFNVNIQPNSAGKGGTWKADDFVADRGNSAEYLINTYGDTIRNSADWQKSEMLAGTAIKMSNGYGIIADTWNVPHKLYKPDLTIEVGYRSFYNTTKAEGSAASKPFSNSTHTWAKETGYVSEDNFYHIYPASASGNPKYEFKLQGTHGENVESEVMSGKYDIYVVMVPNYYMTSTDSTIVYTTGTQGTGYIDENGDTIPVKHKILANIKYCDNASNGTDKEVKMSTPIEYSGEKVDTILLYKDFEFPYTYKNLLYSYPTMTITTKTTSGERKKGYSNDICIDRILLISKED